MDIYITDSSATATLSLTCPKTGVDHITDYIGNTGALADGQYTWDGERDAYVCTQRTYDWWSTVVTDRQALDDRLHDLTADHGYDAVVAAIGDAGHVDLEDYAASINTALDDAFGAPSAC